VSEASEADLSDGRRNQILQVQSQSQWQENRLDGQVMKLSQRQKLILALLRVCGPQPAENIIQIIYSGQRIFLRKQHQYLARTLRQLEQLDLITQHLGQWALTERGHRGL